MLQGECLDVKPGLGSAKFDPEHSAFRGFERGVNPNLKTRTVVEALQGIYST